MTNADESNATSPVEEHATGEIVVEVDTEGAALIEHAVGLEGELIAWKTAAAQMGVPSLNSMQEAAAFSTALLDTLTSFAGPEGVAQAGELWRLRDEKQRMEAKLSESQDDLVMSKSEIQSLKEQKQSLHNQVEQLKIALEANRRICDIYKQGNTTGGTKPESVQPDNVRQYQISNEAQIKEMRNTIHDNNQFMNRMIMEKTRLEGQIAIERIYLKDELRAKTTELADVQKRLQRLVISMTKNNRRRMYRQRRVSTFTQKYKVIKRKLAKASQKLSKTKFQLRKLAKLSVSCQTGESCDQEASEPIAPAEGQTELQEEALTAVTIPQPSATPESDDQSSSAQ